MNRIVTTRFMTNLPLNKSKSYHPNINKNKKYQNLQLVNLT